MTPEEQYLADSTRLADAVDSIGKNGYEQHPIEISSYVLYLVDVKPVTYYAHSEWHRTRQLETAANIKSPDTRPLCDSHGWEALPVYGDVGRWDIGTGGTLNKPLPLRIPNPTPEMLVELEAWLVAQKLIRIENYSVNGFCIVWQRTGCYEGARHMGMGFHKSDEQSARIIAALEAYQKCEEEDSCVGLERKKYDL